MEKITERVSDIKLTATSHICYWVVQAGADKLLQNVHSQARQHQNVHTVISLTKLHGQSVQSG